MQNDDFHRSLTLLQQLANGEDPATGEAVARDHLLNAPEVMRSLSRLVGWIEAQTPTHDRPAARKIKRQEKRQDNLSQGLPEYYGFPWTQTDTEKIAQLFDAATPLIDIGLAVGRSSGSVSLQLQAMGIIDSLGNKTSSQPSQPSQPSPEPY